MSPQICYILSSFDNSIFIASLPTILCYTCNTVSNLSTYPELTVMMFGTMAARKSPIGRKAVSAVTNVPSLSSL